ncbi:MFS transporter [Candidatus Poribacteria bacterium]|nr:MFS transporter [Candidatus Poribacteria bacterium]
MSTDGAKKALRYRWFIFGSLATGYLFVYFHRLSPAIVAVELMNSFRTGGTVLGILSSAYFYPYAIMQLPAGLLSDSLGPRKIVTIFLVVACIGAVLFGLSPNIGTAIVARFLVGFGVSMIFIPTMKILAEWFLPKEFSFMTGVLIAVGGIGTLAAATPLALLTKWLGWRMSFIITGIISLILALFAGIFVRNRPKDMGLPSISQIDNTTAATPSINIRLWDGIKQVLTNKDFWPLAIWFFCDGGIFFTFGGLWGAPYLMQVYGLTKAEAGYILNMLSAGMIIGSPILSLLSDKVFMSRKVVLVGSTIVTVAVTAVLTFFTEHLNLPLLYFLCLLLGIFTSSIVNIAFTSTKELFPKEIAGTSTGTVNIFPFAGGAVFQPLLGYILEKFGKVGETFTPQAYSAAFGCLFAAAVVSLIAILFMKETIDTSELRSNEREARLYGRTRTVSEVRN